MEPLTSLEWTRARDAGKAGTCAGVKIMAVDVVIKDKTLAVIQDKALAKIV